MKSAVCVFACALVLSGCASSGGSQSPWLVERPLSAPKACAALNADQELVLSLSQEMSESGRLHAALANLERLPAELPEARLGKARILRVLGRDEAGPLYRGLLNTCLVAEGHHGLGQLAAARQQHTEAVEHLRAAVSLSPANAAMRNDLGVVYMNMRNVPQSQFELMTAMELAENDVRAAENLLTLMLYQDHWQQASTLSNAKRLTPDQFREAERRAQRMKQQDQPQIAVTLPAPEPRTAVARPVAELPAPVVQAPVVAPVPVVSRAIPASEQVVAEPSRPVSDAEVQAFLSRSQLLFGNSTSSVLGSEERQAAR